MKSVKRFKTWTAALGSIFSLGLFALTGICAEAAVEINDTNFPDENFRTHVMIYDTDSDGTLSDDELNAVTYLDCSWEATGVKISDMTGIGYFTALQTLRCTSNNLTELDLSHNTALIQVHCYYNQISSLDFSNNPKIQILNIHSNQLTILNTSNNLQLKALSCFSNQLSSIDISNNTKLQRLWCQGNQLTALDISQNPDLYALNCRANQISSLNVLNNPQMFMLRCYDNDLTELEIWNNPYLLDAVVNGTLSTSSGVSVYRGNEPQRYIDGSDYENRLDIDSDVTIYTESSTVSFDANGGTGAMDPVTVTTTKDYTLPDNGFTAPKGKEFDQWDLGNVGDAITVTADTVVTAQWKDIPVVNYTVSFAANGGTGAMSSATVEAGSTYTLPDNGFTAPEGKEFDQWDLGSAGDAITVTADTVVTAQWKDKPAAPAADDDDDDDDDDEPVSETVPAVVDNTVAAKSPKTGEDSGVAIWTAILLAGAAGVVMIRNRRSVK